MKNRPIKDDFLGGPRGIRTLDLLNAIETRSQLRYGPKLFGRSHWRSQFPNRGLRALWAQIIRSFPLALSIPQQGTACAMGPNYSVVPIGAPNSPTGDCVRNGLNFLVPRVPLCADQRGTVVDLEGVEPSTSSVRLRRAPTALQAHLSG